MPRGKTWTKKEVQDLKLMYKDPDLLMEDIASKLGRSIYSVSMKASRLGLKKYKADFRCGFDKDHKDLEVKEILDFEAWVYCSCGHVTKYFEYGRIELWAMEGDSVIMGLVKVLDNGLIDNE